MGAPDKQVYQILGEDQKAAKTATSAPGCFVHGKDVFSEPVKGNAVQFFVTGTEYFDNVAKAIEGAQSSVFITGWQVNFDVVLTGKKTLWTCLRTAVRNGASVYVMPWMSPKVGVDTGDLETALTVIQLNAGLPAPRAFVLPAVSQCDQPGALGIAFSHHQKLVVIDNKFAYVGGIDLAYGRRDDGKYSLKADGRQGSEFYNSCVPPIHSLSSVEQTAYLTRAELVAACFDNKAGRAAQFFLSAPMKPLAGAMDAYSAASDKVKDVNKQISDWWVTSDVVPEFVRKAQDKVIDAAQESAASASKWAYQQLGTTLQTKVEKLREYGGAHVADATTALMAWLNGATLDSLPPSLLQNTADTIQAFVMRLVLALQAEGSQRKQCYANLEKLGKLLPAGGKCPDSSVQPRMPWHDVHCRIEGPSVYDLSRNFVRRWNGVALQYERSDGRTVDALLRQLGIAARLKAPRIGAAHRPVRSKTQPGSCWVQVLRSAPKKMRVAEAAGEAEKTTPSVAESSCLSAMLKNIEGASHFIYIEGQFFQSDYGSTMIGNEEAGGGAPASGPMHALMDVKGSPGYQKYAAQLGILGVPPGQIYKSLKWSQIDDVQRDIRGGGADFVNDLKRVMATQAQIAGFSALGPSQKSLKNPICKALGDRITRAIYDGKPFHVYMVLPVHPEGTLDTINIMTQQHLTMQSLVFGSHSLVNRIRRALLAMMYVRERKMEVKRARELANEVKPNVLDEKVRQVEWEQYLTLLNLRNWDVLKNRPVTEQIYVHSKLLIADDRVVVLGSANINDRSQLGDRDSELAVIIHDDKPAVAKLDGNDLQGVGSLVQDLRKGLWRKHFGLMGGAAPAGRLGAPTILDAPANRDTWQAIKTLASANAEAYANAFPHLAKPRNRSSIWATWDDNESVLKGYMPFNERFWRPDQPRDECFTWDAKQRLPEKRPAEIRGFIVALPLQWTLGENNDSKMNLTTLANVDFDEEADRAQRTAAAAFGKSDRANT
ncbi:Phospholipase D [Cupriavidus taiwanensis]|uniref:phospholipase D-like domain-containing protein n=1 Tax=Cupriavidus taiwanensis TaxID=164546 RepID=UPI000E1A9D0A|nr:phospholipase D-like domain-containing protein [Cupriavidus taiwanensis]SPA31208.1 Phospholipase D [Cupriavidus taiwanensis]